MLANETINTFLEKVAIEPSTPAGGSIAALNAASAAALAEMTANLMAGKIDHEEIAEEMKDIARIFSVYRAKFIADMDRDSYTFGKVIESLKMPVNTDNERNIREKSLQKYYKDAVLVPLDIAKDTLEMMLVIKKQLKKVNDSFITDTAQAFMLAEITLRSLIFHIKANLIYINDDDFKNNIENAIKEFKLALECQVN